MANSQQLNQIEMLFGKQPIESVTEHKEKNRLIQYWQRDLINWVKGAYYSRHHRGTTGWSTTCTGFQVAGWLHRAGKLTDKQLQRYSQFNDRIQRLDKRPYINNIHVDSAGYDCLGMRKIDDEWDGHSSGLRTRSLNGRKTVLRTDWKHHLFEISNGAFSVVLEFSKHPATHYGAIKAAIPIFSELGLIQWEYMQ